MIYLQNDKVARMASVRGSFLDVYIAGEWVKVCATLDETALTLSAPADADHGQGADIRTVRIVKHDGSGLGISIKGVVITICPLSSGYLILFIFIVMLI